MLWTIAWLAGLARLKLKHLNAIVKILEALLCAVERFPIQPTAPLRGNTPRYAVLEKLILMLGRSADVYRYISTFEFFSILTAITCFLSLQDLTISATSCISEIIAQGLVGSGLGIEFQLNA